MELSFRSLVFSQLDVAETEPDIISVVETIRAYLLQLNQEVSDELYESVMEEALHSIRVSMGKSFTIEGDNKVIPWFENYYKNLGHTRWDRYQNYLLKNRNLPKKVVFSMRDNLMKIIELAGDPNDENFLRKGLIIGDVQSGKTANYVGLMNLAIDVKYKVIIVLTGTTNTLREQTQIRIEEGLGKANLDVGVKESKLPEYQSFLDPIYLTSRENDFLVSSKNNFQASVESTREPVVIVTKKNSTALKNIYEWLVNYSKRKNDNKIDYSLMLIDDEADFASVNTKNDDNPTIINRRIRSILQLFTKSSYIGFTATPYANIFIEPDTNDEMYGQDLFPSDYIYVLGESEDYMGVQSVFDDEPKYPEILQSINPKEVDSYLPLKHKKNDIFDSLSPTMRHSINVFLLANAIRDIRGHAKSHRSMLINVSRFVNMHDQIKLVTQEYLEDVKRSVRLYSKLPFDDAIDNYLIKSLYESYENEYESKLKDELSFIEILSHLNEAIFRVKVVIVNSNSKELNYLDNQVEGERVIVVGGFALSRGLTLEGLMVSFYYRNSVMYDSLLQMGRWFGYRKGYEDLCRIYMTEKVIDDFRFIALATKELKEDLKVNSDRGLTPLDFGIKVRTGQVGLIITARNKMGSSKELTARAHFTKDIIETTVFSTDVEKFINPNNELIKTLVDRNHSKISNSMYPGSKDSLGLKDVDKDEIIWFLNNYVSIDLASKFDSNLIIKWLEANNIDQLHTWDVAFSEGSLTDIIFDYGHGIQGASLKRTVLEHGEKNDYYRTTKSRLGSPSDGRYGLNKDELDLVLMVHKETSDKKSIPQKEYFIKDINRKPILIIYSIVPVLENDYIADTFIPLISIGIPELDQNKTTYVEYRVNRVYLDLELPETEEE